MRCSHCGSVFRKADTIPPFRASCTKCARVAGRFLVTEQGDGVSGFREVMIRQDPEDLRRKLLETQSFHFTVFVDEREKIVAFDLEDREGVHLLRWRRGRRPAFYGIANVGKGYHNRNEVQMNGRFSSTEVISELAAHGQNIRGDVRDVLLEGINAYR
jgi:hypothetical protein